MKVWFNTSAVSSFVYDMTLIWPMGLLLVPIQDKKIDRLVIPYDYNFSRSSYQEILNAVDTKTTIVLSTEYLHQKLLYIKFGI
jgi:hypothetical protein